MTDPVIPKEEPSQPAPPETEPPTPIEAPVIDPPAGPGDWRPHDESR